MTCYLRSKGDCDTYRGELDAEGTTISPRCPERVRVAVRWSADGGQPSDSYVGACGHPAPGGPAWHIGPCGRFRGTVRQAAAAGQASCWIGLARWESQRALGGGNRRSHEPSRQR
ncbi:MAG: hypothetical protein ACRDRI_20510 [Pseudonocardiaceae bacterium]